MIINMMISHADGWIFAEIGSNGKEVVLTDNHDARVRIPLEATTDIAQAISILRNHIKTQAQIKP